MVSTEMLAVESLQYAIDYRKKAEPSSALKYQPYFKKTVRKAEPSSAFSTYNSRCWIILCLIMMMAVKTRLRGKKMLYLDGFQPAEDFKFLFSSILKEKMMKKGAGAVGLMNIVSKMEREFLLKKWIWLERRV